MHSDGVATMLSPYKKMCTTLAHLSPTARQFLSRLLLRRVTEARRHSTVKACLQSHTWCACYGHRKPPKLGRFSGDGVPIYYCSCAKKRFFLCVFFLSASFFFFSDASLAWFPAAYFKRFLHLFWRKDVYLVLVILFRRVLSFFQLFCGNFFFSR